MQPESMSAQSIRLATNLNPFKFIIQFGSLTLMLAAPAAIASNQSQPVASPPVNLSGEELEQLHEFTSAIQLIKTNYVDPVSVGELMDRSVEAMYEEAGLAPMASTSGRNQQTENADSLPMEEIRRFSDAIRTIRVQKPEITTVRLLHAALRRAPNSLDQRSKYISHEELKELVRGADNTGGVGLSIKKRDGDAAIVDYILPGSPLAGKGVQPGDRLLAIDGSSTNVLEVNMIIERLRGDIGSTTTLLFSHQDKALKPLKVARTAISTFTNVCRILDDEVMYVRLHSINQQTVADLTRDLQQLAGSSDERKSGVILDLRDNPGGILAQSVRAADLFLEKGTIVFLQARTPAGSMKFAATAEDMSKGLPIVVLVNQYTASGAELIAAALQDNHRATVIGQRTMGMNTVQTIFPLAKGALKLTTGRLLGANGESLETGMLPDVIASDDAAVRPQLREKDCPGALSSPSPLQMDVSLLKAMDSLSAMLASRKD